MVGRFVVLEGRDYTSKTTLARRLATRLAADGHRVVEAQEPSASEHGQFVRQVLRGDVSSDPMALRLLFAADAVEHARRVIRPALDRGDVVICDRWTVVSNRVYGGASTDEVAAMAQRAVLAIRPVLPSPDVVLLLDCPDEVAEARAAARASGPDMYDGKRDFQRTVAALYRHVRWLVPGLPVVTIDASGTEEEVEERAYRAIAHLFAAPVALPEAA